jgi:hypothetical protein
VLVQISEFVTDISKDTSFVQGLSVFHKLRISKVLYYRPQLILICTGVLKPFLVPYIPVNKLVCLSLVSISGLVYNL